MKAALDAGQRGIIRDLPYGSTRVIRQVDGKTVERQVNYAIAINSGGDILKITDEVSGYKSVYLQNNTGEYSFSYKYALGNDFVETEDDFYWNLVSSALDGVSNPRIDNFSFVITMPHEFDTAKVSTYSGYAGDTAASNLVISFDNNVITGNSPTAIQAGHGITIRIVLPEGYFTAMPPIKTPSVLSIVLFSLIMSATVVFAVWLFQKWRKPDIPAPIGFYPPKGLTPPDTAYIYGLRVLHKHLLSFLMYWDSKKYIKLGEIKKNAKRFDVEILKYPETMTRAESQIWNACFGGKVTCPAKITITANRLANKYETFNSAVTIIKDTNKNVIDKKRQIIKPLAICWFPVMVLITLFVFAIAAFMRNGLSGIQFSIINKIIPNWWAYLVAASAAVAVASVCLGKISIRCSNAESLKLYGEILGFREFISVAKKEQIEMLVEKNPSYFFDILPYAFCLDVTDKFVKNFKNFAPKFVETNDINFWTFMYCMNFLNYTSGRMVAASVHAMSHSGGSRGFRGGFGGGGGFSGGGFGGGGSRGF
jgi:uncharacterized membrane protein YgcG